MKLAFRLAEQGVLSEAETLGIYSGQIEVAVRQEFLDAVAEVATMTWIVKPAQPSPTLAIPNARAASSKSVASNQLI